MGGVFEASDIKREKVKILQTFDLNHFVVKSSFNNDESQNYLIFQSLLNILQHWKNHTKILLVTLFGI